MGTPFAIRYEKYLSGLSARILEVLATSDRAMTRDDIGNLLETHPCNVSAAITRIRESKDGDRLVCAQSPRIGKGRRFKLYSLRGSDA